MRQVLLVLSVLSTLGYDTYSQTVITWALVPGRPLSTVQFDPDLVFSKHWCPGNQVSIVFNMSIRPREVATIVESLNQLSAEVEFGSSETGLTTREFGLIVRLREGLRATARQYILYATVYLVWGSAMDAMGKLLMIAEFRHWWQVLTCYVVYLVPVSLMVRGKSRFEQYVYGVFALGPLELLGYALGTSIAHNGNIADAILGPRNFTLAMCLFFGIIPPIGNELVRWIEDRLFGLNVDPNTGNPDTQIPEKLRA